MEDSKSRANYLGNGLSSSTCLYVKLTMRSTEVSLKEIIGIRNERPLCVFFLFDGNKIVLIYLQKNRTFVI